MAASPVYVEHVKIYIKSNMGEHVSTVLLSRILSSTFGVEPLCSPLSGWMGEVTLAASPLTLGSPSPRKSLELSPWGELPPRRVRVTLFGRFPPPWGGSGLPFGGSSPPGRIRVTLWGRFPPGEGPGHPLGEVSPQGGSGSPFGGGFPPGRVWVTLWGKFPSGEDPGHPFWGGKSPPPGRVRVTRFGRFPPPRGGSRSPFGGGFPPGRVRVTHFGRFPPGEGPAHPFWEVSPPGEQGPGQSLAVTRVLSADHNLMFVRLGKKSLVVLDRKDRLELVKQAHVTSSGLHCSLQETRKKVSFDYYWPSLDRDVTKWVKQCSCRQKPSAEKSLPIQGVSSKSQRTRDPLPVLQVEAVTQAFEQVGLGLVGPLMETANGFRFILLSVDAYSRWVEAAPLKEQNPVEVASALIPFLLRFGRPQLLVTTLRVPFVSQVNRSLHRQLQGLGVPLGKLDIIVSAFQPKINSILSLTASSIRR
ncbi:uncharacterized protein LOC127545670 isoform X2 [Antechinus flavipes]|uniref:uncharacterized protein LOC127545670 isoform X2 n=1 Tax=Antechinus flavipes TaxID=38775 RepID=UPI002235CE78|nr:uncharacterized protein LOC127545670 isoform X2 [Antechinus flavipes]